jgi:hypothetical protein
MDFTGLDEITAIIIDVIQKAVDQSNNWPPGGMHVFPDLHRNDRTGITFYLFHAQENGHYKNFPSPGNDIPPVSFTPMGLNLFYQLTSNSRNTNNEQDAIDEQKLMSVAMKALHDNPVLLKTLPTPAFPAGKDINIKITLQTLSPSESVQYWAAAESPVRLSAYYEVSVVFMEPEKHKSYSGRVLQYGNFVFIHGAPQVTAIENTLQFKSPVDGSTMQVKVQPAQAPTANTVPPGISSILGISGNGFNYGSPKFLLISPLWEGAAEADPGWLLTRVSETRLNVAVQPTAILQSNLSVVDVLPGLYGGIISVTEERNLPDGSRKTFVHVSNQYPFSVIPRIDGIVVGLLPNEFTVTGFIFQHPKLKADDIQVYVGETKIELASPGPPSPGEFQVTGPTTIDIVAPITMHGVNIPVRILVRGVESSPAWVTIP